MASGTLSYANLPDELVSAVPEFAAQVTEHIRDNDELLPHVLFGAYLVPFLLDARRHGSDEFVTRVLTFADRALWDGDDAVRNVIDVSFVEDLVVTMGWQPAEWADAVAFDAAIRHGSARIGAANADGHPLRGTVRTPL